MEYCSGGSLSTHSIHKSGEAYIARLIYKLISAVMHMHSMGVIHRNLNLKNILFTDKDLKNFKIINLGSSCVISEGETNKKQVLTRSLTKRIGSDGFTGIIFFIFSFISYFFILSNSSRSPFI